MEITEIRHLLHNNPGLSGDEHFAHDLVVAELEALHPDELNTHVGGFGVVALWRSASADAKTLAFRADIDALPSGHRCGHDGHCSILLDFARRVASDNCRRNNMLLVFQPEEETGKGAKKIIDSGLLKKYGVDAIFGLHNLPGYEKGVVVLNRGTFAAASSGVIYSLRGRETHASTPEKGLNPGIAVAQIIERFDKLTVRKGSFFKFATLICCRVGKEAFGTSAGSAELMFTLRCSTNEGMAELIRQADAIVLDIASEHSLGLEKQVREPFPATENTPEMSDRLMTLLAPNHNVVMETVPFRWSEDFGRYLLDIPGAFFGIGSGVEQPELHNPAYDFPDDIIPVAASCFETIMNEITI